MSTSYPGPASPQGEPAYPTLPPPTQKRRPSGWWFGMGAVLLLLAVACVGIAGGLVVRFFVSAETSFPMRGTHAVRLPANTQRMVFGDGDTKAAHCTARGSGGVPVVFRPAFGSGPVRSASDFARFDTGDGLVVFRCRGSAADTMWVTAVPGRGSLTRLVVLGIAIPLLLGAAGFVTLLVTTVLWVSRRPSPPPYVDPARHDGPPPAS